MADVVCKRLIFVIFLCKRNDMKTEKNKVTKKICVDCRYVLSAAIRLLLIIERQGNVQIFPFYFFGDPFAYIFKCVP